MVNIKSNNGELMSYYELLQYVSEGNFLENGMYRVSDGIVIIDGECGEEIDFVELGNIRGNKLRKVI